MLPELLVVIFPNTLPQTSGWGCEMHSSSIFWHQYTKARYRSSHTVNTMHTNCLERIYGTSLRVQLIIYISDPDINFDPEFTRNQYSAGGTILPVTHSNQPRTSADPDNIYLTYTTTHTPTPKYQILGHSPIYPPK